jgi:hypothetical protein
MVLSICFYDNREIQNIVLWLYSSALNVNSPFILAFCVNGSRYTDLYFGMCL